ncbi:hypothetical protein MRB53_021621 [Persea americana]|uniref:Uncharacterized protein n=1 Tax=Persea americana TaxID=3435 RepID=A0ACC2L4D6_PERAE|nr:hypothetical protein MRB53_021621 [Persea americana]
MEKKLMVVSEVQCTVLEVKVIEGLGTTIDVVLANGLLHEGDQKVFCGMQGPIVTTIRALLTPHPMRELRVKGVSGAIFVLITFAVVVCQLLLTLAGQNDLAEALVSVDVATSALDGHHEMGQLFVSLYVYVVCSSLPSWFGAIDVNDGRHEMGQLFVSSYVYVVCSSLPPWFGAIDVNGIR